MGLELRILVIQQLLSSPGYALIPRPRRIVSPLTHRESERLGASGVREEASMHSRLAKDEQQPLGYPVLSWWVELRTSR
jgi:hypothetical protein